VLRLVSDENFKGDLVRALQRRVPGFDCLRVQDLELASADDPTILAWCAAEQRILLTHDRQTMPGHALKRLDSNQFLAGLIVVDDRAPFGLVFADLLLLVTCSENSEWENRILFVPLS
jgi:hypothetical protein